MRRFTVKKEALPKGRFHFTVCDNGKPRSVWSSMWEAKRAINEYAYQAES